MKCCSPKRELAKVLPHGFDGPICITTYDGEKMCVASDRDAWPWFRVQRQHSSLLLLLRPGDDFDSFETHPMAKKANLNKAELVMLRLYTGYTASTRCAPVLEVV